MTYPAAERPTDASARTDQSMAARIRAGDVDAFESMFHLYYGPLHAYVVGLVHDSDVADECVQDVMYRIWKLGPRWRPRESIKTYLYAAARNRVFNHQRHRRVVERWELSATAGVAFTGMGQGPEPTDEASRRRELSAALRGALQRLPERCRQVMTLRAERQMTNVEIAAATGISVRNVERHITRALKALRAELAAFF